MTAIALYNEIEPYTVQWLRNLIDQNLIAPGRVEDRSIEDLTPFDFADATQAHFFAGIGVWSHALRLAGWSDDVPVWTGSCPCQPFSSAGQRKGFSDERHLWPSWYRLIRECRPPIIFGEQVAGSDGIDWLDVVLADLEGAGYACGAADLPACSVGAPHIRQRLYFVAYAESSGWRQRGAERFGSGDRAPSHFGGARLADDREVRKLADTRLDRCGEFSTPHDDNRSHAFWDDSPRRGAPGSLDNACSAGARRVGSSRSGEDGRQGLSDLQGAFLRRATRGFWRDADWIYCRDEKWRATQRGLEPLAHGTAFRLADGRTRKEVSRAGVLRGIGNAIVAPLAAAFIEAAMEILTPSKSKIDHT